MLGLKLIQYLDKDSGQHFQTSYDHVTSHVGVVTTRLQPVDYTLRVLTSSLPLDNKLVFYYVRTYITIFILAIFSEPYFIFSFVFFIPFFP